MIGVASARPRPGISMPHDTTNERSFADREAIRERHQKSDGDEGEKHRENQLLSNGVTKWSATIFTNDVRCQRRHTVGSAVKRPGMMDDDANEARLPRCAWTGGQAG